MSDRTTLDLQAEGMDFLAEVFSELRPGSTIDLLHNIARGLGGVLGADTTFVAYALDDPPRRVRGVASWKRGKFGDECEYELAGNPCQLVYEDGPTFIPCDVADRFHMKRDSGYESFIGIPLRDSSGVTVGHLAVYSSMEMSKNSFQFELARLCASRIESEVLYTRTKSQVVKLQSRTVAMEMAQIEAISKLDDVLHKVTDLLASASSSDTRRLATTIYDSVSSARGTLARVGSTHLARPRKLPPDS